MRRGLLIGVGAVTLLIATWFVATETGMPTGGLSRDAAIAKAKTYVSSSTPPREEGSVAGPYLVLGWTIRDARNPFALVWRVTFNGVYEGHCLPSEVNVCFPATTATVVINYFNGDFLTVFYDR